MDPTTEFYLTFLIIILITIPLSIWIFKIQKRNREFKETKFKELINSLSLAFNNDSIRDLTDFIDFINGDEYFYLLGIIIPYDLINLTNKVKHIIIKSEYKNKVNSIEKLDIIKLEIESLVKETELKDPFNSVPSEEKSLLIDILEISNQKNNPVFTGKLHKMGELIKIREDIITRAGKDNEESLKLAKQSKYLAIIFFIISLFLTIYPLVK
ncbi:hypothetical protein J2X97_000791 [Epilithonimonas hungarica]|uniref:hypothetical protein n=1 Tax=Epilithonimonas hungarica TaxID=454006 RepID=UPI0027866DAD|nr:hypothetical protein [Epilithonimonas hungarica]MDP9955154.1 hypothetical protein [Epilithonimonas hungarica]